MDRRKHLNMVRGEGSVQSRLFSAYLSFHTLKTEDFPEELQEKFDEIMKKLTDVKTPVADESIVQATLNKMSNMDASDLAEKIFSLYTEITRRKALKRT